MTETDGASIAKRTAKWKTNPPEREILLLVALGWVIFAVMVVGFRGWNGLSMNFGDNGAYLEVATAISRWNFHGLDIQHFMGYPYTISAVSTVTQLPLGVSMQLVSFLASVISTLLVCRSFGTWVAGFFAFTNFAWIQTSFLGGSETLAVALGLGAFWSFRRGHILLAALLGSLATTVRPLMIFALVGIGIALLCKKQYANFLIALTVGLAVGLLYVWPLAHYFGDPLLTVHSYTSRDYGATKLAGPHGQLFGWPFHGIVVGTLTYPAPWTNLLLSFAWIALVTAGTGAMFTQRLRDYWRVHLDQAIFCGLYLFTIFCYDYLVWARSNFMRFSILVLPFIFYALLPWLPKDRRVLWCASILGPILAASSAIGIQNMPFLR